MTFLLSVTIKIALLTLVALAATVLLRRRSAALRHWVLATGLLACFCIPALELWMPAWSIPLPLTWSSSSADSSLRLVSESVSLPGAARPAGVRTRSFPAWVVCPTSQQSSQQSGSPAR